MVGAASTYSALDNSPYRGIDPSFGKSVHLVPAVNIPGEQVKDMEMTFHYWFMFPIAIFIATAAMSSGVEGATFFSPLFMLARGFPPEVAIGTGLITEAFGFASGHLARFVQSGGDTLNTVLSVVIFTVPGVIIGGQLGSLVASRISQHTLERGLGALFILVAAITLGEVVL